jgi:hypothetical protein
MFKPSYLDREHIPRRQMLFGFTSEWLEAVVVVKGLKQQTGQSQAQRALHPRLAGC